MNDENLNQMSGINEAERNALVSEESSVTETRESMPEEPKVEETRRLTPEEPTKEPGGGGFLVALLIIAIIALLGTCVYGVFYGSSKGEKFIDMVMDDYIFEMPLEMIEVGKNDGKVTSEVSVDAATLLSAVGADIESIDKLIVVTEQNKKGEDMSGKLSVKIDSSEIASIDYAKTGDLVGIKVPDLFEEYIVVRNDNLKALAEKFGVSGEDLNAIPDKISEEELMKTYSETLEAQSIDSRKLEKVLEKYKKPLMNAFEDNLTSERNQLLTIKNEELSFTKHTLSLTEKALYEVAKDMLEIAKNDKELYELIKEQELEDFDYETFEEWQSDIVYSLENADETIADASDETLCELSVYVKDGDTYAIELVFVQEEILARLAGLNEKNSSYIELALEYTTSDDQSVKFIYETEKDADQYESEFKVSAKVDSIDINIDILKETITYEKDASLEKIEESDAFVLNDEDMTDIENKLLEILEKSSTYLETITGRLPAGLVEEFSSTEEDYPDYDYDYSYDDEFDFDSDYDYTEDFELKVDQVYVLEDSNAKYEKIKLNAAKAEVIALMGEPTFEDTYEDEEYYYWSDEYYNEHSVVIENGVVTRKSRDIDSSSYNGIQLSSEIGTTIADLDAVIGSVKEDMTLAEVEAILGNKYIEVEKAVDGETEYVWYDVNENNVSIIFDENNVVDFIGFVWGSY
ncbi:MAG: hypothetical protein IJX99_08935 [Clostridia bacterium]|nr:hypothetical protein [Clostridia bacterium]